MCQHGRQALGINRCRQRHLPAAGTLEHDRFIGPSFDRHRHECQTLLCCARCRCQGRLWLDAPSPVVEGRSLEAFPLAERTGE